jgi:CheY-like chemotaxis protein
MAKILIIDDSSFARNNLKKNLQQAGYSIVEAANGAQGLELAQQENPDLITLDLLMPGMTGQETLPHLKKICPEAKIIILSADIQTFVREELLAAGANAFLNKPAVTAELLETIAQLLK